MKKELANENVIAVEQSCTMQDVLVQFRCTKTSDALSVTMTDLGTLPEYEKGG